MCIVITSNITINTMKRLLVYRVQISMMSKTMEILKELKYYVGPVLDFTGYPALIKRINSP